MSNPPVFRAVELMDMAVRIEEQGRVFYEACRSSVEDPGLSEVFQYLAGQEVEHARVFSRMKESLDRDEALPESYPGELRSYLDAFVSGEVFDDPETAAETALRLDDPDHALEYALEIERQSILFYSAMKPLVRTFEAGQVDRVLAEERDHIRRLIAYRRRGLHRRRGGVIP